MEQRTLYYFTVVAEELNITKASHRLHMSQPPLSLQIKNLEEELGAKLFVRGKRQLKLTEEGELLYRRAKEILKLTEKTEADIKSINSGISGTISIGLVEGMAPNIAAEWISTFISKYPHVKFHIIDGSTDDLVEKLRSGLISLAVITAPYDTQLLNSFSIGKEQLVAFMDKNNHLASIKKDLTINDLKKEPLIIPSRKALISRVYKWYKEHKCEPNIVCIMDSYLDAAALALKGVGVSIFPQTAYVPNSSITYKKIKNIDTTIEYLFAWKKDIPLPTIEETFIEFVRNFDNK